MFLIFSFLSNFLNSDGLGYVPKSLILHPQSVKSSVPLDTKTMLEGSFFPLLISSYSSEGTSAEPWSPDFSLSTLSRTFHFYFVFVFKSTFPLIKISFL